MEVEITRDPNRLIQTIKIEMGEAELFTLSLDRMEELIDLLILSYQQGEELNSCALLKLALMAKHYELKGDIDDFLRLKPAADLQPSDSAG